MNLPAIHNDVKGKGRAIEFGDNAPSPAAAAVKAEEEAAGTREKGKTMKKHYSHMIADVPGKLKPLGHQCKTQLNYMLTMHPSQVKISWQGIMCCVICC